MKTSNTDFFSQDLYRLDASERTLVLKSVRRLELSTAWLGKSLAGNLSGLRSIKTGHNHRLRILYLVADDFGMLLSVGPRQNLKVYIQAARRLAELDL